MSEQRLMKLRVLTSLEQVLSVHKEIKRVFLRQLDSLADDVIEMVGCQVVWYEIPISEIRFRPKRE